MIPIQIILFILVVAIFVQYTMLKKYIPEIPNKRLFFTSVLSNLVAAAMIALYYVYLYFYYFRNVAIRRTGDIIGTGMFLMFSLFADFFISILAQYFFLRYVLLKEIAGKKIRGVVGVSNFITAWVIVAILTVSFMFFKT